MVRPLTKKNVGHSNLCFYSTLILPYILNSILEMGQCNTNFDLKIFQEIFSVRFV